MSFRFPRYQLSKIELLNRLKLPPFSKKKRSPTYRPLTNAKTRKLGKKRKEWRFALTLRKREGKKESRKKQSVSKKKKEKKNPPLISTTIFSLWTALNPAGYQVTAQSQRQQHSSSHFQLTSFSRLRRPKASPSSPPNLLLLPGLVWLLLLLLPPAAVGKQLPLG